MTQELVRSPQLDKRLLRMARSSAREIEEATGIPAAEVAERLSVLLDDKLYRDDLVEEKLLLVELSDTIRDLRDRMQGADNTEDYVALARVMSTNVKTMLDQIERRRKAIDVDLMKINEAHAKVIAMALEVAAEKAEMQLREEFPEVPRETVHLIFQGAFLDAVTVVEDAAE
jgi:hypothetical protein